MGGKSYEFTILKSYSESKHYEILSKKKGIVDTILEQLGLKKPVL